MIIEDNDDFLINTNEEKIEEDISREKTTEISPDGLLNDESYPLYKKMAKISKTSFDILVRKFVHNVQKEYNGKQDKQKMYIVEDWWGNADINNITDLFTEECRIRCTFGDRESPLDYWEKNKSKMLKTTLDIMKLREMLYFSTKLCNNFRISVAITILRLFKTKRWIDISAGWGDRLIAAIGSNIDYYFSTDPNMCLRDKYPKIIDTLAYEKDKGKFVIDNRGFEHAFLPQNKKFDLCFSSPPFYDLEDYSSNSEDSITQYKSEDEWYKKFLIYSIRKAINVLTVGGHVVLYMGESNNTNYIPKMIKDVSKYLKYKGIIYYYYKEARPKLRAMYVWRKIYDENPNFILQTSNNIDIIRDDLLEAGTKQRVVISIVRRLSSKYDAFIIPISEHGIDGLTLAYACRLFNKGCHVFTIDSNTMLPEIKSKIEKYGGIIHSGFKSMDDVYVNINTFKENRNAYQFRLGYEDETFGKKLEKKLKFTLGTTFVYQWITKYDEVWVAGETGFLSRVLFNVFKNSKIFVVQLDKDMEHITDSRYEIIKYDSSSLQESKIIPPFKTLIKRDGKAWELLVKSNNNNNKKILFWNTCGV